MKVKPVSLTFYQLMIATRSIHMNVQADIDRLHDIWLQGAPTPDSRLLGYKKYDPRLVQPGNIEKRLILPAHFKAWVDDVTQRRGITLKADTAYRALNIINRTFNQVSYDPKRS